jgi:hypothetical protein
VHKWRRRREDEHAAILSNVWLSQRRAAAREVEQKARTDGIADPCSPSIETGR